MERLPCKLCPLRPRPLGDELCTRHHLAPRTRIGISARSGDNYRRTAEESSGAILATSRGYRQDDIISACRLGSVGEEGSCRAWLILAMPRNASKLLEHLHTTDASSCIHKSLCSLPAITVPLSLTVQRSNVPTAVESCTHLAALPCPCPCPLPSYRPSHPDAYLARACMSRTLSMANRHHLLCLGTTDRPAMRCPSIVPST